MAGAASSVDVPGVSILVPTYNYGRYLGQCLTSALTQSHTDLEILVLDDASEDDTRDVVREFHDSRIRYHRNPTRLGHTRTFNLGIRQARGRFISILSGDDFLTGEHSIRRRFEALEALPDCGVVFGDGVYVDEAGAVLSHRRSAGLPEGVPCDVLDRMLNCNLNHLSPLVFPCSEMVRRESYAQVGLFDERFEAYEDFELWLRLAGRFPFAYVDHALVSRRIHRDSQTYRNVDTGRAFKDVELFIDVVLERYPQATAGYKRSAILAQNMLRIVGAGMTRPSDLMRQRAAYAKALRTHWPCIWGASNARILGKCAYLALPTGVRECLRSAVARRRKVAVA